MKRVYINGKYLNQNITGVQRVAHELTKELLKYHRVNEFEIVLVTPPYWMKNSIFSIFWEQLILPILSCKGVLISLCNVGPVLHFNHIVMIHDLAVYKNANWFSRAFSLYYKVITPLLAFFSRKILTVSEFSKNEIKTYLGQSVYNKTEVIYNGIDLKLFKPTKCRSIQIKLGVTNPYFLCVGSLEPRKNLERVIKAWELAQDKVKDVELVIVGKQNSRIFSTTNFEESNNIYFTGYVSDEELVQLYSGSVAFLFPSLYEGFGLPALESLACGRPVVVSENSAMSEITSDYGLTVDPLDVHAIKDYFITLKRKPPVHESEHYRDYLSKNFAWKQGAELLIKRIIK